VKRGDVVTVVLPGSYGKPRPAVIVQADVFDALPSVTVLPLTSALHDAPPLRIDVPAGPESGIRRDSQIMIDKIMTVPRTRLGPRIGALPPGTLGALEGALGRFLGLA
jgi:mRNA interferase MazF